MTNLEMIDKLYSDLKFIEALFILIEYATEDGDSYNAVNDVSHWMGEYMKKLEQFVNTDLAHAFGLNLPDKEEKAI